MRSSFSPCGTPVSTGYYPPSPPHIRIHRESTSLSSRWKRIKSGMNPRRIFQPLSKVISGVPRGSSPQFSEEEDKRGSLPLQLIRNDGHYHHVPQPSYSNNGRSAPEDEIRPYDEEEDADDSPPYQLADPGRRSQQIPYQQDNASHHQHQHTDSDVSELKN